MTRSGTGDDQVVEHRPFSCRHVLIVLCFSGLLFALIYWGSPVHDDPTFSVRVNPASGPKFNLTLRVDNDQDFATCREQVTATVLYGGTVVVGWADVPDFCVDKRASAELSVPLSHGDVVVLTDDMHRRMAVELRSGELELVVEMRLVFPKGFIPWDYCYECHQSRSRQTFQMCSVKPEQGYAQCQRLLLV
ncbi:hypothetical protein HU200_017039 [Digitaria exilis]|uniref:Uncharacterized protein n=1 Tax=Digitaria exilis TaxID=1010633 RepID=A0A835KKG9_9POAL|nr:hypothetical protein HU200_017039 [Digitaria exilis]